MSCERNVDLEYKMSNLEVKMNEFGDNNKLILRERLDMEYEINFFCFLILRLEFQLVDVNREKESFKYQLVDVYNKNDQVLKEVL